MTWSYTLKPNTDSKDRIRLMIGDTNELDQLLQDEEIEYFIDSEGGDYRAAWAACEAIAGKFARMADQQVGQVSLSYSQIAKNYREKAEALLARANRTDTSVYAGGISIADKASRKDECDRVQPKFTKDLHEENP